MPRLVERRCEEGPGAPGGRRARASCTYRAFVRDTISALEPGGEPGSCSVVCGATSPGCRAVLHADSGAAPRFVAERATKGRNPALPTGSGRPPGRFVAPRATSLRARNPALYRGTQGTATSSGRSGSSTRVRAQAVSRRLGPCCSGPKRWPPSGSRATRSARSILPRHSSIHAAALADEGAALQREWMQRAGRPRAGSAAAKLIALLPAQPIVSAPTIRAAIGTSQQQALEGLKALAAAGVVRQISEGSYDRQFSAPELFDLVTAYEERIAGRPRG